LTEWIGTTKEWFPGPAIVQASFCFVLFNMLLTWRQRREIWAI